MDRRIRKGLGWSALAGFVVLAGCDLSDSVYVPTQPGEVPGSKAPVFVQSDWDDGRPGTIEQDSADWFRIDLQKDSSYSVTVHRVRWGTSSVPVKVEVYSSLAYEVLVSDAATGSDSVARVVFASRTTGPVRVRVSDPVGGEFGKYRAVVRKEDRYETDDVRNAAHLISTDGVAQSHRISDLDVDWVEFRTESGKYYEIVVDRDGVDVQPYTEGGQVILADIGFEAVGSGWTWGFKGDGGSVYAKITKSATSGKEGAYQIKVRTIDDPREPDDSADIAAKIGIGPTYSGVLLPFTEDWLQFDGVRNQGYKVKFESDDLVDFQVVDSVGYIHATRTTTNSAEIRFAPQFVQPVRIRVFSSIRVVDYKVTVTTFDTTVVTETVVEEEPTTGPI